MKNSPYLCFNKKARYSQRYRKVDSDLHYKKRFKINLKNYPILFGRLKKIPYLCIINLKTMKNLSVRLLVLVSVGAVIYYFVSNKTSEVKKEIVATINEVEPISENTETEETETKIEYDNSIREKERPFKPFIDNDQIMTYSNGIDTFTLEIDYLDDIRITHVVEHGLDEGHSWDKKNCVFKNNNIYVDWIDTKYKVNSDVLIITENDKSTKYKLIDINLTYR